MAAAAPFPATAPAIDPRVPYFLLPPGYGRGYDLVNPGKHLSEFACSYSVAVGSHKVIVRLKKKCFEIFNSPPAAPRCKCAIKKDGTLTVGWHGDIKEAWHTVLEVLGIGEDGNPLPETQNAQPARETHRAAAATNECDIRALARLNECYDRAINGLDFGGASRVPLKSSHSSSSERFTIMTSTVGATAADTSPVLPHSCPKQNDPSHDSGDEGKLGPFF